MAGEEEKERNFQYLEYSDPNFLALAILLMPRTILVVIFEENVMELENKKTKQLAGSNSL